MDEAIVQDGDLAEPGQRAYSRYAMPRMTIVGPHLIAVVVALIIAFAITATNLTIFYLGKQDLVLLFAELVLLYAVSFRLKPRQTPIAIGLRSVFVGAGAVLALCIAGHFWVLDNYDMSRDEQMATFDAMVFRGGHLAQALPTLWRDHAEALNLNFMLPAEHRGAWISGYLPGNAALRALVSLAGTQVITGPLLTALGAIAMWGCARRIWPTNREAAAVALLLYLGAGQITMTGMTAYAMPAHLTLNLVWLWLFLRKSLLTDLAALVVGFIAVGLHQPLMHPVFAGPLLCLLILPERQWKRAVLFALGYAAIGLFWLSWPGWSWAMVQAGPVAAQPAGVDYLTRLTQTVQNLGTTGILIMLANLLRFIAWQHLLLIPLLLIGIGIARRDRLAGALATAPILMIAIMTVILPYQGHGFGYRYLHALNGNCILIAVYGWMSLGERRAEWRGLLLRSTAASIAVILPLQAWMAHGFYASSAEASTKISALDADYAIIGRSDVPFAFDLVYNPPLLDRRPVRLVRDKVDPGLIDAICRRHASVALVGSGILKPIGDTFDIRDPIGANHANAALAPVLVKAGCTVSHTN
ncbi:MAG: hypothetical protein KGM49_07405 [Sphingomonadales bacterium]|nr:hypothetical protein [Sphingomonadales bacterium]